MIDKKLFAKNSLSGFFQKIVIAIITFLAIPIFIRTKGIEIYGTFAAITILGEVGRFTELGFSQTLVKFLSNQGKTKESSQDLIVASIVVISLLIPVTILLFWFNHFILAEIFKIPGNMITQTRELYFFTVSSNTLILIGSLFSSVIESQRLIYKINLLQFVYSLLYWGLIILVLLLGLNLREIGIAIFSAALVWFLLTMITMRRNWGKIDLSGFQQYFKISFKKLTNYSLKIYMSSILSFLEEPLIKILVSNFFGVTYVGYLDVGIRIKGQIIRLLQTLIYPFFQIFSEIKNPLRLKYLIKDIEEKLFLMVFPLCIIIGTCTSSFIHIWLNTSESTIILSTIVITTGALLMQFAILPTIYYLTIYHPTTLIFTQIIIIVIYVIVIYVGHLFIGYNAIYLSFIFYYFSQIILRLYYQKKYLNCTLFTDRVYLKRFLISVLALSLFGFGLAFIFSSSNLLNLILSPIALIILTILLYRYLNLITLLDIRKIMSLR